MATALSCVTLTNRNQVRKEPSPWMKRELGPEGHIALYSLVA